MNTEVERIRAAIKAIKAAKAPKAIFTAAAAMTNARTMSNLREVLDHIDAQAAEIERLRDLITSTYTAKGRHHMQLSMCDLYDAVGLFNVRPVKETP